MGTKNLAPEPEPAGDGANFVPEPTEAPVDVVASPSYHSDGTPNQTPGFVELTEPE